MYIYACTYVVKVSNMHAHGKCVCSLACISMRVITKSILSHTYVQAASCPGLGAEYEATQLSNLCTISIKCLTFIEGLGN